MVIGVDFDNTIVSYDALFWGLARERNLIPGHFPANKVAVRDYLRDSGRETIWTELQVLAYGERIQDAVMFPGAIDFFLSCARHAKRVVIISHKAAAIAQEQGETEDILCRAASNWLAENGFYDPGGIGLTRDDIYFESTRAAKIARIASEPCTHYVDDLPEVLDHPDFPGDVTPILFDPARQHVDTSRFMRVGSWQELRMMLFGHSEQP